MMFGPAIFPGQGVRRPKLSDEQQAALDAVVSDRKNVVVIAKAGTGKTTFSIHTAEQFFSVSHKRTLLLTYNAELKVPVCVCVCIGLSMC